MTKRLAAKLRGLVTRLQHQIEMSLVANHAVEALKHELLLLPHLERRAVRHELDRLAEDGELLQGVPQRAALLDGLPIPSQTFSYLLIPSHTFA